VRDGALENGEMDECIEYFRAVARTNGRRRSAGVRAPGARAA